MTFDEDGGAWVLDDPSDLIRWEIIGVEAWKPGVVRLFARTNLDFRPEFRAIFARGRICEACGLFVAEGKSRS